MKYQEIEFFTRFHLEAYSYCLIPGNINSLIRSRDIEREIASLSLYSIRRKQNW